MRIVEWRALRVEGEVADFGQGRTTDFGRAFPLVGFDLREGHGHRDIDLSGPVGAFLRVAAVEAEKLERIDRHMRGVAVKRALFYDDALLRAPFGERKRTVADVVGGLGPLAAVARHGARMNRNPGAACCVVQEARRGLGQRDDESAGVGGAESHGRKIVDCPGRECASVLYRVEQVGLRCSRRGAEEPAIGSDEIVRGDRIAVGPVCHGSKVKRVDQAVRRDVAAFRGGRERRAAGGIGNEQPLAKGADDEKFIGERRGRRVEIGWFVALAQAHDGAGRGGLPGATGQ